MLKIHNTLTRKIEEFRPIDPEKVGIYTCGPTVYREVHIGNFRTYIGADILRRVLMYNGYRVVHIKNITDVGHIRSIDNINHQEQIDPIIEEAIKMGKTPQEIAKHFANLFFGDEKKLNILPATVYPKATENVKEMIEVIKALIKNGFAYEVDGTVYFNVKKFKNYGKLSGNTLSKMDNLLKAVRVSLETDKKDSVDFALWKKAEKGRLIKWDSPWGVGFPGWHIECSAMSIKYLGDTFDLHTGGEDLIFPHHEDEIAQSEAATGRKFVNYWLHGGYLLVDGAKMSRSKGNVYTVSNLEKKGFDPLSFRYLTLTIHYRTRMNFTFKALEAAQTALNNLREIISKFDKPKIGCAEYEENFLRAINDDFDIPKALSIVWDLIKSDYPTSARAESLFKFDKVLGLDLENAKDYIKKEEEVIPQGIMELVEQREEIKKLGYEIEDLPGHGKKDRTTEVKKI